MQYTGPGSIVIDYDAETGFSVEDQATGIVAYTNDASAVYSIVRAFGAAQADEDSGPYRDSGDEDPHA